MQTTQPQLALLTPSPSQEELQARLAVSASAVEELEARVVQLGRDLGTAQACAAARLPCLMA